MRFWRTDFSREFIEAIHLILFPHVDYSFINIYPIDLFLLFTFHRYCIFDGNLL